MADSTDPQDHYWDELEQLRRDNADAQEWITAIDAVLAAMGRPVTELDRILDTIVDSARRLCHADVAQLHLAEGNVYRLSRQTGLGDEYLDYITDHPITIDRGTLIGRVGLDRRAEQLIDVLADPDYGRHDAQKLAGYRTIMGAPMLQEDLVGVLSVWRNEVDSFDERSMERLARFASQAAIAIRNRDLVRALELRKIMLDKKVEHLEALRHIGEAVNSTLDLDKVLDTIVEHAVQLSGADGGSLLEFQQESGRFVARSVFGTSEEVLERLRGIEVPLAGTFVGRAANEGRPLQLTDLASAPLDDHLRTLLEAGWRSIVAVPMLRDDQIVGVLVVRAKLPRELSDDICDVLQTFASQSAIAIANARLYTKLRHFLPKQVADLIFEQGDMSKLSTHRAKVAVVFCDLRGFTSFAEVADNEDVMAILGEMHVAFGGLIAKYDGTLERFTGDGLMVFLNDPTPQDDFNLRAIHMAIEMQAEARRLAQSWARKGFELALGIGIADGWATVGPIGFEGRTDYAAIGSVTNKAARLCADAEEWQTLVTKPVSLAADESVTTKLLGERYLKGFRDPVATYEVTRADEPSDGQA